MAAYMLNGFPILGTPAAEGYQLRFYVAGTSTPSPVYHDSALSSAWAQPIVFTADGVPDGPIFLPATPALKISFQDENDVELPEFPVDNFAVPEVN